MTANEAIESLAGVCDSVFVNERTQRHVSPFTGNSTIEHEWTVTTFDGEKLTAQKTSDKLEFAVELARLAHLRETGQLCGEWDPVLLGA